MLKPITKKIVAIGGGEIKDHDTLSIDKHILELTGKSKPTLLFLPTASGDAQGYWEVVQSVFEEKLGAETSVLMLTKSPSKSEITDKLEQADAIYVGGGNTQKMLQIWEESGVDVLLRSAYERGCVCSGLSAVAICWFEYGSTDSPRFENPTETDFVLLEGLGFVSGLASPHHIREPKRSEILPELVKETGVIGFGIDDNAAIEIIDGTYKVLSSKPNSVVTKVYLDESNTICTQKLLPGVEFEI